MVKFLDLKKKSMPLYTKLKEKDLVYNEKDFHELVLTRQIKIDDQFVNDPKLVLEENKKYSVKIGILEVII